MNALPKISVLRHAAVGVLGLLGSSLFFSEPLMAHEPARTTTDVADGRGSARSLPEDIPIRGIRVIRGDKVMGSLAAVRGAEPASSPNFHEHVAPILFQHCAVCHRKGGDSAPFPLLTLADARKHAREMVDVTERRFMPPWLPAPDHLGGLEGERRLTEAEIATFRQWRDAGMPEGDPAKSPPAPQWSGEWLLGPPDLVLKMPAAYTVPAAGKDVYRHFIIPVTVDRKRYVKAWQFRPNSRSVHHIFLMFDRSGEGRRRDAADPEPGFPGMDTPVGIEMPSGHFSSWQPGAGARRIRPGLYWALEPNTDAVIQMHLQPLGRPEPLQAEIGFYFTDQAPTSQPVKLALSNWAIDIPAGATNVVVTDELVLPADADLLAALPHSHYLCRRIEGKAFLPGGAESSFFLIPNWDFNWQGDYAYRTPPRFPAGTRLTMAFHFDNSTANPRNPNHPPRPVRYGVNTTDEMAELWLQFLPTTPADAAKLRGLAFDRGLRDIQASNEQRLRIDPKDSKAVVNLGRVHLARRRYDEARQRFAEAAAMDPRSDEAHYYLGVLHRLADQPADAMKEFRRAIEINPANARAIGNLGLLHAAAGEIEAANRYLTEAIRLDPRDAVAVSTLGTIRYQQGKVKEAVDLFALAVQLDPTDAEARQFLEIARRQLESGSAPPP